MLRTTENKPLTEDEEEMRKRKEVVPTRSWRRSLNFHQPEPGEYCVENDGGWKNILLVAKVLLPVVKCEQARLVLTAATELESL